MEDVFFGVSDGVSESCFSSTLDEFLPEFEDSWFNLGDGCIKKQVTCTKNSPSHESDSGLSSVVSDARSPLSVFDEEIVPDCVNSSTMEFTEGKKIFETDPDLFSFLMSSDDEGVSPEKPSNYDDRDATTPPPNHKSLDLNMNVTDTGCCGNGYNLRTNPPRVVSNQPTDSMASTCTKQSDNGTVACTKVPSVKLVRLVTPVAVGKAVSKDDVVKAIEVKNKKNAQNAKMNREKKKVYIKGLEEEVDTLKAENHSLKHEAKTLKSEKAALSEEVVYLKSVLANQSSLSALLKNIPSVKNVNLSTSFQTAKRGAEDDHDYEGVAKKRKGGVCLHVEGTSVSLEFCSRCSKMASNDGVNK